MILPVPVARLVFAIRTVMMQPLRIHLDHRSLRRARAVRVDEVSFQIAEDDLSDASDLERIRRKLADALHLITVLDNRWKRRLASHNGAILVENASSSGYLSASDTILLAMDFVRDHDAETIAGSLIHEATHARLEHWGIRAWPDLRPRIERRCLMEQIYFLKRLPGRDDLVTHYEAWLTTSWWSADQRRQRRINYFRTLTMPNVITRVYQTLSNWWAKP